MAKNGENWLEQIFSLVATLGVMFWLQYREDPIFQTKVNRWFDRYRFETERMYSIYEMRALMDAQEMNEWGEWI